MRIPIPLRNSLYSFAVFSYLAFHPVVASAQEGTAPSGYYPDTYNGDMFTGTVVQTTDDSITLNYTHGSKSQSFVAYTIAPCHLPSKSTETSPMPLTKVPLGSLIEVFYEAKTVKDDSGRKQKKNEIVGLTFLMTKVNGKWVNLQDRVIFYCTPNPFKTFKAF